MGIAARATVNACCPCGVKHLHDRLYRADKPNVKNGGDLANKDLKSCLR